MKLQPNFSWQKYEDAEQNQEEQFHYQLQRQHKLVANAVNATINDISYYLEERATGEGWVDGRQIFTQTWTIKLVNVGANNITHNIDGLSQMIQIYGSAQDTIPLTAFSVPIPYVSTGASSSQIGVYVTNTQIVITLGSTAEQNFIAYVTMKYTKS